METAYSLVQFQSLLQGLGYLPTPPTSALCTALDLTLDTPLSQAIQAFQNDYQLLPSGQLDRATQERARQLIRNLQHSLNLVVQTQLPLNGFYSMATIHAIELFQKQQGMPVTGIADHGVRQILEREVKQQLRSQMALRTSIADPRSTSAALG